MRSAGTERIARASVTAGDQSPHLPASPGTYADPAQYTPLRPPGRRKQ